MFGYVHISPDKLTEEESARYRACYCGLCHTLGQRYGLTARMILNYDLVFWLCFCQRGMYPDATRSDARFTRYAVDASAGRRRPWMRRRM